MELGLRCEAVAEGLRAPFCPKLRRRTSLGRAVLRVLLSRLLRMLPRCPLKPVEGRLLSLLPLCGLLLPACGRLSPRCPAKFPCPLPGLPGRLKPFLRKSPRLKRSLSPCPFDAAPWWNVRPLYQLRPPLWCQLWPPREGTYMRGRPK